MDVLVLGASGMLGNAMFRKLAENSSLTVYGSIRSEKVRALFPAALQGRLVTGLDAENPDSLTEIVARIKPRMIVNCVGLVKQLADSKDPLKTLPLNSILPHRLALLSQAIGARLVHISTDCVFSGLKGNYTEADPPDASDLYGRSKLIGEVDYPHAITLRTSIVGYELAGSRSLVGWFLAQKTAAGYTRAVFSGLPTVELARVVRDYVLPKENLSGVYHVSSAPISKYELLTLVAKTFKKDIEIRPDESLKIDRSLNSKRFTEATGYAAPAWPDLVQQMYDFDWKEEKRNCV